MHIGLRRIARVLPLISLYGKLDTESIDILTWIALAWTWMYILVQFYIYAYESAPDTADQTRLFYCNSILFMFHVQAGFHATKLPNQVRQKKVCIYMRSLISPTSIVVLISFFLFWCFIYYS